MIQESFFSKESFQGLGPLNQPIYGIEQILENERTRKPANLYPKDFDLQKDNLLICGDNAEVMQRLLEMNGGKPFIDLIYIDPPFCSNRNYGTNKTVSNFDDKWSDGLHSYLPWLIDRIIVMQKLLKDSGQFFIHLDWHAVHYVKVEMDKIFKFDNFRNEIIWCYSGGGTPKKDFPRKHDTILRYAKSSNFNFLREFKPYKDNTQQVGKHSTYVSSESRDIDLERGTPVTDWWTDINTVTGWNPEKLGYPTQKPEDIVRRLINSCTNKGDVVADFFCGSGTTCSVAQKLGRHWIGVDQNPQAIEVAANRIKKLNSEFRILEQKK
jgi:site-specific DNA-methyltransferase (adenine-specific)